MRVVRNLDDLPVLDGSVVTIGNFDGLHRGHEAIIRTLHAHSAKLGLPAVAMTFEPHPLALIAPERAPTPISTPQQRIRLLAGAGIDILLLLEFSPQFRRLTPEAFISRYLVEGLRARVLCVGHNFRFGLEHRGTIETLRAWGGSFDVVEVPPVSQGGHLVSSSLVRESLACGNVSLARRLLGRCYEMEGSVVGGEGRGARTTVPTLNMEPRNRLVPGQGVYITEVRLDDDVGDPSPWYGAVTNIGVRPTFGGVQETIETYIPDHAIPARNGAIRLKFLSRLRDERRFGDAQALRAQILRDVEESRRFFRRLRARPFHDRVHATGPEDAG